MTTLVFGALVAGAAVGVLMMTAGGRASAAASARRSSRNDRIRRVRAM